MVKVRTGNGIYEVRKPGGKLGSRHMTLLMRVSEAEGIMKVPTGDTEDKDLIERVQAQNEKIVSKAMLDLFETWAPEILPHIIVDGPHKYEDMPGEDQFAVFVALSGEMKLSDDFFQVLPEKSD